MAADDQKPASSWRDVYELVRDTRADIMVAVGNVDTKVTTLGERVTGIEEDRLAEKVARKTADELATKRNRTMLTVIGASRNGIAILVSIASLMLVLFKS